MEAIKLGGLSISEIFESENELPLSMALPQISADDLARLAEWHRDDRFAPQPADSMFRLSSHSYLLQVDGLNLLIDTCNGNHKQRTLPFIHELDTAYLANLARTGIKPEQVDLVLCTHLHVDHVGWNTRLDDGRWVPTFPNARYLFSRRDLEHYREQEHEPLHREAFEDSVLPVIEHGLADIVESDHRIHREIGDGVWLEDAAGHSPGHVFVCAQRQGARAIFTGDTFHHPIQLVRPDLPFFADHDPAAAIATRLRLLESCADTDTVLFPAHFRGGAAGRVRRDGDAYRYHYLRR